MAGREKESLRRDSAFWDSSAVIPLCIRQGATPRALSLYGQYRLVVWWATPVEIASALARLLRMRQITPDERARAHRLAATLSESWAVVQPSDGLRSKATGLVEKFDLRAADALQLASALEWCEGHPHGRAFLTTDRKLRDAALLAGFEAP